MMWLFCLLVIPLLGIGISFFFYWRNAARELKNDFWKITLPDTIQLFMLGAIIYTIYLTFISIKQQSDFNKDTLRPWVYPAPDSTIPFYFDASGYLRFTYNIKNIGQSPACSLRTYAELTLSPAFPTDDIKQLIIADTNPRTSFLFPDEKMQAHSGQMMLTIGIDSLKLDTIRTMEILKQVLVDSPLHMHTYMEYCDINKNLFALKTTFFLKCKSEENKLFTMTIYTTYNSAERINLIK